MRKRVMFLAALGWALLLAAPALAAGRGERVGKNTGDLLGSWAHSLYIGVTALISVGLLLSRKIPELAAFMFIAVVVGGFVLAPERVASTINGIWQTIAG